MILMRQLLYLTSQFYRLTMANMATTRSINHG